MIRVRFPVWKQAKWLHPQVASYLIGPRKGRFNNDGTVNDMPGHSVPLAALGGSILLVCFLGPML